MRVLYDHQIFSGQTYGGISRYFFELIKRFPSTDSTCAVSGIYSNNAYLNTDAAHAKPKFFPNKNFKGKIKLMNKINLMSSVATIKKGNFDLFHPTYYDTYFIDKLKGKPFVLTFHDVIHERFADKYPELSAGSIIFEQKRIMLERASKVIAVSHKTKADIIEIYNTPADKINVIHLGNSLTKGAGDNQRLVAEDYILYVGDRTIYKNFQAYLTSIADLLIANKLFLVCAGSANFSESELALFKQLGLEKWVIHKKISNDGVLSNLYSNALFFVFASLYEGFGIPVLESFACNCPTLLSTGGSLPEVGGDATAYFDPYDANSMHAATEKLINDKALRESLRIAGSKRLGQFSWDNTFKETYKLYQQAVS